MTKSVSVWESGIALTSFPEQEQTVARATYDALFEENKSTMDKLTRAREDLAKSDTRVGELSARIEAQVWSHLVH